MLKVPQSQRGRLGSASIVRSRPPSPYPGHIPTGNRRALGAVGPSETLCAAARSAVLADLSNSWSSNEPSNEVCAFSH